MKDQPTVSVVTPAFNLQDIIGKTISSVLNQTQLPEEMLVVDDGSTDQTPEAVRLASSMAPPGLVRLIHGTHQGPGAARNLGIMAARSEWVAFLDGDDLWHPEKVARLRQAILNNPQAAIVTHDMVAVSAAGKEAYIALHKKYDPKRPLLPQLYRCGFFGTSCMAVRVHVLREAGGFDPRLPSGQDHDLWLRIARRHTAAFIPAALTRYIDRPGNISSDHVKRYRCQMHIAHRHAPHVLPFTGRLRAYWLRLRYVLVAHYVLIKQFEDAKRWATLCTLAPEMAVELLRALLRPLKEPASDARPLPESR